MVRIQLSVLMHQVCSLHACALQLRVVDISTFAIDLWREHRVILLLDPSLSKLFLVGVKESFPFEREVQKLLIDRMDL